MWQIKYVSAKNFMSFEEVEHVFENQCYIVRGKNLDNDGQESNGGGKTSFADIAAVALFGYSLTGRNVKNCVNWSSDEKSFTVQVFMINEKHGLECHIVRKVYSGSKGQELSILVNGEVPKTIPSKKGVENGVDIKEGNAYILKEILDITEDDLLNYYFISKKHYAPFLEVNTDKKLEVIGRFSRANVIDSVIEQLESNVSEVENDMEACNTSIAKAEGHIEALNLMLLDEAREKFQQEKIERLDAIAQNITILEAKVDENLQSQHDLEAKLTELKSVEIVDYSAQIKAKQDLVSSIRKKHSDEQSNLHVKNEKLSKWEAMIKGALKCPKCDHQFHAKGEPMPAQVEIDSLKEIIASQVKEIANLKVKVEAADKDIAPLFDAQAKQQARQNDIKSVERQIKNLKDEHSRLVKQIQAEESRYANTDEHDTFENQSTGVLQQLSEKNEEIQGLRLQLEELSQEITNIKKWVEHFYDLKFYIGNKPLQNICALVNQYLERNGSDLNLFIEGFKKLRGGEVRQALNPVVYRNWTNPQPLDQFSEGERARLNLTVDLAFQQLINSTSKYGGLDYYQNDELLNPLDSLGVANAAKAFNGLNKTIMLVSHSGADMVYENTIVIQKENKVSRIA